jgi:hypothetical protein
MSADPSVMPVMAADMRHRDPAHEFLELLVAARPQDQVPVIGHDAPGEQVHAISPESFGQAVQKRLVIPRLAEEAHSPVASIQDMIDHIRDDSPGWPSHEAK